MIKPVILLYWFSAHYQHPQTSASRHKKKDPIYFKFSTELNKLTPSFQNQLKVNQKLLWLISPWKRHVVRRKGSEAWQGNYNKNLESRNNFKFCVYKKIQESNIVFSNWFFFYFLCFFCVHFFSFALLTIIRTTKRQRTYINKASNINKLITMALWQNQGMTPYWIFREKKFNLELSRTHYFHLQHTK